MTRLDSKKVSPYDPNLLITDERSIFQSKRFVDGMFKRANEAEAKAKAKKEAENLQIGHA